MLSLFLLQSNFKDFFSRLFYIILFGMLNYIPYARYRLKNPAKLRHNNTFYSSSLSVCCCLNGMKKLTTQTHTKYFLILHFVGLEIHVAEFYFRYSYFSLARSLTHCRCDYHCCIVGNGKQSMWERMQLH